MELVEGVTFVKYVRPRLNADGGAGTRLLDVARLRTSLLQLAEGVQALHDAGIVHCDISRPTSS